MAAHFVTRTAAAGVCFNAHYLLAFTHTLLQYPDLRMDVPYLPRLLTEQAAEKIFRAARATLGGENFTIADFFNRCDRVTAHYTLRATHEGTHFRYPLSESAFRWDEILTYDDAVYALPMTVTAESLSTAILDAKLACIVDMLRVGVDVHTLGPIHDFTSTALLDELDLDDGNPGPVEAPALRDVVNLPMALSIADNVIVRHTPVFVTLTTRRTHPPRQHVPLRSVPAPRLFF